MVDIKPHKRFKGKTSLLYRLSLLIKTGLLAALWISPFASAYGLAVIAQDRGNDQWRFQIQGAKAPADVYRLIIRDLITQEKLTEVDGFQATGIEQVLVVKWACTLDEGLYYLQVFEGQTLVHGESAQALIWEEQAFETSNAELDRRNFAIRWQPFRASLSRTNVALPSGLRLGRATSWRFHSNTWQEVPGDFLGEDGRSYRDHPQLRPYVQSIPLPSHWLVVGQPLWESYREEALFHTIELPDNTLNFTLSAIDRDSSIVRIQLDPETQDYLTGRRYEVLLYLNGEFIHEESQGVNPYTYVLPENSNLQGEFQLTVNLLDYSGNWGTRTLLVNLP